MHNQRPHIKHVALSERQPSVLAVITARRRLRQIRRSPRSVTSSLQCTIPSRVSLEYLAESRDIYCNALLATRPSRRVVAAGHRHRSCLQSTTARSRHSDINRTTLALPSLAARILRNKSGAFFALILSCHWHRSLYTVVQKKPHRLYYTLLMQLFNIKLNEFHQNVRRVQGNEDYVATFMYLLNILCKLAQSILCPKLLLSAFQFFEPPCTYLELTAAVYRRTRFCDLLAVTGTLKNTGAKLPSSQDQM